MANGFLVGVRFSRRAAWLAVLGAVSACSSSSAVIGPLDFDGGPSGAGTGGSGGGAGAGGTSNDGGEPGDGDVPIPPGGSVGNRLCSATMPCRTGLACSGANVCEPGGMLPPGSTCVLNAECAPGNVCNWIGGARVCGPAGTGVLGTSCQSNSDCAKGFRCSLVGFGAKCTPEGTVDVGGACKTSAECFGGLACFAGKCTVTPPTVPPFGVPTWPGATCEADTGAAISYFRVPRGSGDKDFYRLPFPNDIRTKNGHPDFTGYPTPGTELLGFDPVARYLNAIETDNDGFSPYSTVFFRFNTQFDLPDPKVKLGVDYVDVTQGTRLRNRGRQRRHVVAPRLRSERLHLPELPRRADARRLHVEAWPHLRRAAPRRHDSRKRRPGRSGNPEFSAMLAATAPADAALTAAYATYKPVRDYIAAKSIAAGTIINAAVFTVGHPEKEMAERPAGRAGARGSHGHGLDEVRVGHAFPVSDATADSRMRRRGQSRVRRAPGARLAPDLSGRHGPLL